MTYSPEQHFPRKPSCQGGKQCPVGLNSGISSFRKLAKSSCTEAALEANFLRFHVLDNAQKVTVQAIVLWCYVIASRVGVCTASYKKTGISVLLRPSKRCANLAQPFLNGKLALQVS